MHFRSVPRAFLLAALLCARLLALSCEEALWNMNADLSASEYTQPHARPVWQYDAMLGPAFEKGLKRLRPGELWLDSAGGMGLAGLDVALRRRVRVVVANTQDFWVPLLALQGNTDAVVEVEKYPGFHSIASVGGVETATLNDLATILHRKPIQIHFVDGAPSEAQLAQIRRQALDIASEAALARRTPRFDYQVGTSESALEAHRGQAKLITDLYGAYFYGGKRAEFLQKVWDGLADGGQAIILLEYESNEISDQVTYADGTRKRFWEFLASENKKQIAEVSRSGGARILVLRKKAGARLVLPELVPGQEVRFKSYGKGFSYPDGIQYRTNLPSPANPK